MIPPDDPDRLVDAIRELADDPQHARQLGRNGRTRFERHHERAVCCRAWTEMLEGLTRRRRPATAGGTDPDPTDHATTPA